MQSKGAELLGLASTFLTQFNGFADLKPEGRYEWESVFVKGNMLATFFVKKSPRVDVIRGQLIIGPTSEGENVPLWAAVRLEPHELFNCKGWWDDSAATQLDYHPAEFLLLTLKHRSASHREKFGYEYALHPLCTAHLRDEAERPAYAPAKPFGMCPIRTCPWLRGKGQNPRCAEHSRPYQSVEEQIEDSVVDADPESLYAPEEDLSTISPAGAAPSISDSPTDVDEGQGAGDANARTTLSALVPPVGLSAADFTALDSNERVEILRKLSEGQLTGSDVARKIGLSKSSAFKHMEILEERQFIERIDEGRKWIYFRITDKGRAVLPNDDPGDPGPHFRLVD